MKKKYLLTVGALCLALCGCGAGGNDAGKDDSIFEETENAEGSEAETAQTPEGGNDGEATDVSTIKPMPSYRVARKYFYNYYDGDMVTDDTEIDYSTYNNGLLFQGYNEVLLMDDSCKDYYPEMYQTLSDLAAADKAGSEEYVTEQTQMAKEDFENSLKEGYEFYGPYASEDTISIIRSDEKILSYYSYGYDFLGGVHGSYGIGGQTYDVETGKEIAITDVVKVDEEEFNKVIKDKLLETAEDEDQFMDLDSSLSHYRFNPKENDPEDYENYEYGYNWYLGNDGLHVVFNPYEIAAYAYGMSDITIGYDEFPGMIDERFAVTDNRSYIVPANIYITSASYDEDNESLHLRYTPEFEDPDENGDDYAKDLTLIRNGKSATIDEPFFVEYRFIKFYDVKTSDNKEYIYVTIPEMDDYWALLVYDITGDDVKAAGTMYYHSFETSDSDGYNIEPLFSDPEKMQFGRKEDSFGSFICYGDYNVGADGIPVLSSDYYTVSWCSDDIRSTKEITADVVDENGNVTEQGAVISAGESFKPLRTDAENWIDCQLGDGRIVRMQFTSTEYPATIGGDSVDDLFEGLVYAG
ncbi:MAG: DUF3298 and DUF4163 domain-containing protein [Butyrivibrio sp.]|nr:DUF3298 and DUF4163 domain-containing protein [Butyrivibrio sp.]